MKKSYIKPMADAVQLDRENLLATSFNDNEGTGNIPVVPGEGVSDDDGEPW